MSTLTDDEVWDLAHTDPTTVVDIALEEHDEPQSDRRQEAFLIAGALLAMTQLVKLGCSKEAVARNFAERPWQIRFTQAPSEDDPTVIETGVQVEWLDNVNPAELRPPGSIESNQ